MENMDNSGFLRKNLAWIVILLAFVGFGFLLYKGWDNVVNNEIDRMVTITGHFSCLPPKADTSSEEECVLGVRSRDNEYYALDVSRIQDANTDLKAEDTIAVTGFMKPESEVVGSQWEDFEVKGIILVNTLLRTR